MLPLVLFDGLRKTETCSGLFFPLENAVVGYVAEQQITAVAKPRGAFEPASAGPEHFKGGVGQLVPGEALVEHLKAAVWISHNFH